VYDEFALEIIGSNQDASDICDWNIVSIADQDRMGSGWVYEIGEDDTTPVYKEIFIPTALTNLDMLHTDCQEQVSMHLEVQILGGAYIEIWSDRRDETMATAPNMSDYNMPDYSTFDPSMTDYTMPDYMPDYNMPDFNMPDMPTMPTDMPKEPVRVEDFGGFKYLVAEIPQSFFLDTIQLETGITTPTVDAQMRFTFRNGLGEIVSYTETVNGVDTKVEMIDEFVFTIIERDESSGCESVTATVIEAARSEYTISFASDTEIEFYE
jgi:hypothetical protein